MLKSVVSLADPLTTEIPALAQLYQEGRLKLDEMITRRYRLDDINEAFDDLLGGRVIRAVIDYSLR